MNRQEMSEVVHQMNPYARLIPPKAKTVAEFGCGNGSAGMWFKEIQPGCRYVGIDTDETLLREAGERIDLTICGAIDEVDLREHGVSRADCIVYHSGSLGSPRLEEILSGHANLLAPDGQMLFLLDNPGYFRVFMQALLDGGSPPAPSGPTMEELLQILARLGMSPAIGELSSPEDERLRENAKLMAACERYCAAQGTSMGPDLWVRQHVVRAVRKASHKPMEIAVLIGDPICAPMRVWIPNQCCMTSPGVEIREMEIPEGKAYLPPAGDGKQHVFVYQRYVFGELTWGISWLERLRAQGALVVSEIDDCPMRWEHIFSEHRYMEFVGCHAIQTSTRPLAEYLRQYNPNVLVFENHLELLPPKRERENGDTVTVFFGALNRTEDWQEIMPALNDAIREYGARLRFLVTADRAFFDSLRTDCKEYVGGEYNKGNFAPYELYADALARSDIALLPLRDNLFNRMKSDLKFIEAAAYGAVSLASPTVYERTIEDGRTGLIYRSPREFRERLSLLVEDAALRLSLADAAYDYVRHNRMAAQHYEERILAYRELFPRLDELEQGCRERVAALGLDKTYS